MAYGACFHSQISNLPTCSVEMEVNFVFRTRSDSCRTLQPHVYNTTAGRPALQVMTTYAHTLFTFDKLYNHPGIEVYYSARPHTPRPELWQTASIKAHFMKGNGPQKMKLILSIEGLRHDRIMKRYLSEPGDCERLLRGDLASGATT